MKRDERNICNTRVRVTHLHYKRGPVAGGATLLLLLVFGVAAAQGQTAPNTTSRTSVDLTTGIRHADQFASVQAAIDDLPSCALGSHCGVVVIPQGVTWHPSATTWGKETTLWDYATDSRFPQLWMGDGGEFRLMGLGANQAASLVMDNTATDGSRASSIVFRTGPSTAIRNVWQLRSGNFGNINPNVNADDLTLSGWQGATHTTGVVTRITPGTAAVVGSGTNWTSSLVGGNFLINAQPTVGATVLSVQDSTHLTLAKNWSGTTAGSGASYTITGGSTGTQRARLFVGQNGVYIFNPNRTSADPLAFASHDRGYIFGAPDGGSKTMYVRLNVFQPGGTTGIELRSSDSDAKRKFVVLDDSSNELRVLAADGATVLTQLSDTGNYRVNGGVNIGTGVSADGSGFKHQRGAAGCATAAAAGATCTTVVTWNTAFADANYTAVCSGRGIASGVPVNGGLTTQGAASVTFQTVAATPSAARYRNIECVAVHD